MKRGRNLTWKGVEHASTLKPSILIAQGGSCHSTPIMANSRKKVSARNRGKFARNRKPLLMLLCVPQA